VSELLKTDIEALVDEMVEINDFAAHALMERIRKLNEEKLE
jgi:hypothetical protein